MDLSGDKFTINPKYFAFLTSCNISYHTFSNVSHTSSNTIVEMRQFVHLFPGLPWLAKWSIPGFLESFHFLQILWFHPHQTVVFFCLSNVVSLPQPFQEHFASTYIYSDIHWRFVYECDCKKLLVVIMHKHWLCVYWKFLSVFQPALITNSSTV